MILQITSTYLQGFSRNYFQTMKDMYVERDCTTNKYAYKEKVIETYKGVCLSLKYEGHYYGEGLYNTQVYAHKEKDIVILYKFKSLSIML